MAGEINVTRNEAHTVVTATFTAAASKGHALAVSGAKSVAPAAAGAITVGTAYRDVLINESGGMRLKGDIVPMVAGAAITAGDVLVPGATAGQVITRTTEGVETIVGVAWTAAAAQGDQVLVIVF